MVKRPGVCDTASEFGAIVKDAAATLRRSAALQSRLPPPAAAAAARRQRAVPQIKIPSAD